MTARALLRDATRAGHDRVDALYSRFDLADAGDYRSFLIAQAAAFLPAEAALNAAGADRLFPDWADRRRSALLRADLDELGIDVPAPFPAPTLPSPAAVAGAAYVLEGSRLGGALLARSVGQSLPRRFLAARQAPGQWRQFVARLEQLLQTHVDRERAVEGAQKMFDLFARAAAVSVAVP